MITSPIYPSVMLSYTRTPVIVAQAGTPDTNSTWLTPGTLAGAGKIFDSGITSERGPEEAVIVPDCAETWQTAKSREKTSPWKIASFLIMVVVYGGMF